ncbi:hypothetical protein GF386_02040 [Candidatus Pacearchaeota archaeon]|nr:hypothetical protein [Candidatus Pacearchaeota archaeon]MBD3282954.1 hypothetical protein [Candidatus Pacearchaeota archaeon]
MDEDSRTGTERLFDRVIFSTTHLTPSPEKRDLLYAVFDEIARGHYQDNDPVRIDELSEDPRKFTAYKNLESAGLVSEENGFAWATQEGLDVHNSLRVQGMYEDVLYSQ